MVRRRCRGAVLLEAAATLLTTLAAALLGVELVRRAHLEVALHHGAFLLARNQVLGLGPARNRAELFRWLRRALGDAAGRRVAGALAVDVPPAPGGRARVHLRYPQLLRFAWDGGRRGRETKHHFEVTKSCRFP